MGTQTAGSRFHSHIAYKKVDNQYLVTNVERSKINQVAPIINTETDEGDIDKMRLITENQENQKSVVSFKSHFTKKKLTGKKGIIKKAKTKKQIQRRKSIFRKDRKTKRRSTQNEYTSQRGGKQLSVRDNRFQSKSYLEELRNSPYSMIRMNRNKIHSSVLKELSTPQSSHNFVPSSGVRRKSTRKLSSMTGFGLKSAYKHSSGVKPRQNRRKLFNVQHQSMRLRKSRRKQTQQSIIPKLTSGISKKQLVASKSKFLDYSPSNNKF